METGYHWEAVTDLSTCIALRNRGEPAGFSSLMSPFMSFMMRRANNQDLAQLKRLLEESDGASS